MCELGEGPLMSTWPSRVCHPGDWGQPLKKFVSGVAPG